MKTLHVGNWKIEVSNAAPCSVTIIHSSGGGTADVIRSVRHTELRDLEYVINRAIHACREELGPDHKHEME